jgi:hypothetical protein
MTSLCYVLHLKYFAHYSSSKPQVSYLLMKVHPFLTLVLFLLRGYFIIKANTFHSLNLKYLSIRKQWIMRLWRRFLHINFEFIYEIWSILIIFLILRNCLLILSTSTFTIIGWGLSVSCRIGKLTILISIVRCITLIKVSIHISSIGVCKI